MKVVILAGGFGTRISEESQFKPKPMIEIGGKPIPVSYTHLRKLESDSSCQVYRSAGSEIKPVRSCAPTHTYVWGYT